MDAHRVWRQDVASVEESTVDVAPYSGDWPMLFAAEQPAIRSVFGDSARIDHFGSTAVPGMPAKPIVDILVGSAHRSPPAEEQLGKLRDLGYAYLGEDGRRPGRWFWRKRAKINYNLSLVVYEGELWLDNIALRDYLRTHPVEAIAYARVKEEALRVSPHSLLGYQNHKRQFVQSLLSRARVWSSEPK